MDPATIKAFFGSAVAAAIIGAFATIVSQMPARSTARREDRRQAHDEAKDERDDMLKQIEAACEERDKAYKERDGAVEKWQQALRDWEIEHEGKLEARRELAERTFHCVQHGNLCDLPEAADETVPPPPIRIERRKTPRP